ncbi:hypothetical protein IAT38_007768 [Cryptococcus sp. DSM 104549]
MADASLFLRKRKDKERRPRQPSTRLPGAPSAPSLASSRKPSGVGLAGRSVSSGPSNAPSPATTSGSASKAAAPATPSGPNPNITEIKIFSAAPDSTLRFNLMRLNSTKDADPARITQPILMNRKHPGERDNPRYALDQEGKIIGWYVYDAQGNPVLDAEGRPTVEKREGADMSLVGQAPDGEGKRRKLKKGTKEVYHQDLEVMRLRREEAVPWVLQSGNPQERPAQPETWVGRMVEPSSLPTVLLCNDGTGEGFEMVPLGRSYKFEPERPFKPLDSDAANKLFELQAKHKIHDRWALRPADNPNGEPSSAPAPVRIKAEHGLEERAQRMEGKIRLLKGLGQDKKPKVERYEDDFKREGHRVERGLEGGIDEELDFDEAEEFQDDDDNNTFYRDAREQEEARETEDRLKKEFRLANANVGDRPQIAEDDDEDDLFGDQALDDEGKKLRKIMKKRRREGQEGYDSDDDSDSDSDSDESAVQDKEKEKEKEKEPQLLSERERSRPSSPSGKPHSRPHSRGPSGPRGTSSPAGRPIHPSSKKNKAATAPPGSGASLIAQRATSRGASPRLSGNPSAGRASSPLGRASSPEGSGSGAGAGAGQPGLSQGRASSPVVRGSSPATGSTRGASPAPGSGSAGGSTRDASPAPSAPSGSQGQAQGKKAKPDAGAGGGGKRKSSPSGDRRPKKPKKSKSSTPTPGPEESFPFMITRDEVVKWFREHAPDGAKNTAAIGAFKSRIVQAGKNLKKNQDLFLEHIKLTTTSDGAMVRLKPEYR